MLCLDDSLVIGKGASRVCYRHPHSTDKCIKVPFADKNQTQVLECEYFMHLESTQRSWKHISRYYGEIDTNMGVGYEYEFIRDFDNAASLPLSDYLSLKPSLNIELDILVESLAELKRYLLENRIILRNIRPYNILFKRSNTQEGVAVIIDNFGHHNKKFHLSDRVAYLARKDIEKKWRKFESLLQKQVAI